MGSHGSHGVGRVGGTILIFYHGTHPVPPFPGQTGLQKKNMLKPGDGGFEVQHDDVKAQKRIKELKAKGYKLSIRHAPKASFSDAQRRMMT